MNLLGRLLKWWLKGKTLSTRAQALHSFFKNIGTIVVLLLIAAILTSQLIFGICYFLYQSLTTRGLSGAEALLSIGCGLLLALLVTLFCVWKLWLQMREMPRDMVLDSAPVNNRAHEIMNAFLQGYTKQH